MIAPALRSAYGRRIDYTDRSTRRTHDSSIDASGKLVGLNILFSVIAKRWPAFDNLVEDVPLIILRDGEPLRDRMQKERLDENDIFEAAREHEGLERLEQIKYAILERTGQITIVPK